jgi:hypothetical protein
MRMVVRAVPAWTIREQQTPRSQMFEEYLSEQALERFTSPRSSGSTAAGMCNADASPDSRLRDSRMRQA